MEMIEIDQKELKKGILRKDWIRSASDHNVILIDIDKELVDKKKRFMFDSRWIKMEAVELAVTEGWKVDRDGTPMYQVQQRLKRTRMSLLAWSKPVRDLMCDGGKRWDDRLVRALFKQDDADEILKIKGLNPLTDDLWIVLLPRKEFSVSR
ncbi:succinyl-CoA:3-ketoacid coenzyme A transferase 2B, partial [Striga asiatica]